LVHEVDHRLLGLYKKKIGKLNRLSLQRLFVYSKEKKRSTGYVVIVFPNQRVAGLWIIYVSEEATKITVL
jgi:hypothetical protein